MSHYNCQIPKLSTLGGLIPNMKFSYYQTSRVAQNIILRVLLREKNL